MTTDSFWVFLGVILGSSITFVTQWFFRYRSKINKNRKYFIKHHYYIQENIFKIRNAISQLINFINMDISKYTDEDLQEEIYPSIKHFAEECTKIWNDFRVIIMSFFYKKIRGNNFIILDKTITKICNLKFSSKYTYNELYRNNHSNLQKYISEFEKSLMIIESIEKDFINKRRKFIKRKI